MFLYILPMNVLFRCFKKVFNNFLFILKSTSSYFQIKSSDVDNILNWEVHQASDHGIEVPFRPSRVLLQVRAQFRIQCAVFRSQFMKAEYSPNQYMNFRPKLIHKLDSWRRFLNRVKVENFSSSKIEVNKIILFKFATCKFSTWTWFKNRSLEPIPRSQHLHPEWRCYRT
jgi:hypothetical protein